MNPLSNPIQNQQVFIFTANAKTYMKVSKLSVVCACVCVCGDDPLCAVMCCDSVVMAAWSCRRETLTQEMEILYSSCGTGAPQFTLIMITLRDRDRRGRRETHTHTYGFMCLVSTSGLCIYSNPSAQTSTIMKRYTFILILTRELIWP